MVKLFNNLLVPVKYIKDKTPSLDTVIDMACHFECTIHLLLISPHKLSENDTSASLQVQKLYIHYNDLPASCTLKIETVAGSFEDSIVSYAHKQNIDLIIAEQKKGLLGGFFWGSVINRLARRLRCPVLTFQPRVKLDDLKNIVLPVGTFLPVRKLMFAAYLAKTFQSRLHLIALASGEPGTADADMLYLFKAYRLLKDNTELPVECKTVYGANIADSTLQYARNVDADLIVVNPGKESLLSGFINKLFSRFLFYGSQIPVMTVMSKNAMV